MMCENCINYYFDEDFSCYVCAVELDEDELYSFISGGTKNCPYYKGEYDIVKKQI